MRVYTVKASLVEDTFKWEADILEEAIRDVLNKIPGLALFKIRVESEDLTSE